MHGEMTGIYEIRLTGPGRDQFRLFCLLENGSDDELFGRGSDEAYDRGHRRQAQAVADDAQPR
jgi:hypothetical protein